MKTTDIVENGIIFDPHSNAPRAEDHEVKMARSELYRAGKSAMALHGMLKSVSERQGLEGWVQAKITKAADYLESVYHYLDYEMKDRHSEVEMEAAPVAPAAQLPGQAATPASPGTDALAKQKAAAAVALQRKQIQDQIKALQKQLQDAQKQMTTLGQVANAQQAQTMAETTSAGAIASSMGGNGMGKKKKEVGSLFGGTYKQAEEDLSEIKKGQKDANGYTRCWPGKHAEGTKKGKNGGRVRNCVPNEGVEEAANAAQQAATAIAKKNSGKYDKDGERIKEGSQKAVRAKLKTKKNETVQPGQFVEPSNDAKQQIKAINQQSADKAAIGRAKMGIMPMNEVEEGWKGAAAGAALIGLGAMGAGGQAQAADMNKAGVSNMKAPTQATHVAKQEQLKRYPTDPRPDLKLGSLEDMFFNGNTNHDREIRYLNYQTDSSAKNMTPQEWSAQQGPKNSPMKALTPDQQAARAKLPLRTANWHPDDDRMPATIREKAKDETGTKFTGYWKGTDKGKPGKKMVGDA
jgi:hypothetical protein